jgi:hypothetical protein
MLEATVKNAAEIRQGNDELKQKFLLHYCGKNKRSLRRQRSGSFSLARLRRKEKKTFLFFFNLSLKGKLV